MTEPTPQPQTALIATEVAALAGDAVTAGRPLLLIVHYEFEASKIDCIARLRHLLQQQGITLTTFTPDHLAEHGTGRLYPLLQTVAREGGMALVSGLPRVPRSGELEPAFLEYLNLHRDLIPRQQLRIILFLHSADAATFIAGAGDLWDFRHHTFWLEGRPSPESSCLWALPERNERMIRITPEEQAAANNHLANVRALIDGTASQEEKASLYLDLSRWLSRRTLYELAADAARQGLDLLPPEPSPLRGDLEFNLAYAIEKNNHLPEALTHYQNALAICRQLGDRGGEGSTLNNISQIYDSWGRYDEALQMLEQSLVIRREVGDRYGEGVTLNNIAQIYVSWGRSDEALQTLEQSLTIQREIGDQSVEGVTLNNIASIYKVCGRYEKALETLEQSLDILREVGDRYGEGVTLNNISVIYHYWGRYDEALQTLEQSLAIQREVGDRSGEAATLNNIAQIYREWERYDEALQTLEQSLAIRREIGDRPGERVTCWNLALEYKRRGDLARAVEYLRCAVAIEEETGHADLEQDRATLQALEEQLAVSDSAPSSS